MPSNTHRIRRLRLLVRTSSASSAFSQRQTIRRDVESLLIPALGRAFDDAASDDEMVRVPRLDLRVRLPEDGFETGELARLVEEQTREALRGAVRDRSPTAATDHDNPLAIWTMSIGEHRRTAFLDYLASGRLTWEGRESDPADTGLAEWLKVEAEAVANEPRSVDATLIGTFETRLVVAFRLLQLLSPSGRAAAIRSRSFATSHLLGVTLRKIAEKDSLGDTMQLRADSMLLALREEDLSGPEPRGIHSSAVRELLADCLSRLARGTPPVSSLQKEVEELLSLADSEHGKSASGERTAHTVHPSNTTSTTPSGSSISDFDADEVAWQLKAMAGLSGGQALANDSAALPATDAGIILTHPFLPTLFEAVGLISDRGLPRANIPRAAALLHWIATGRERIFEFEISVIKLLVGLSPTDPLSVSGGLLRDEDLAEADAMLAAMGRHWPALRNTSTAGLRSSFLQRRGLIRDSETGWTLQVETAPFDMLLGQLPWNYRIVKLSWMTRPLFTEWPTP